jgi:L-lactate dehydrogenase
MGHARACRLEVETHEDIAGQTSTEHTYRNLAIIHGVVTAMTPFKSDTILLVVANPIDLLTSFALDLSGLPSSQVFGSGTCLDSIRLRGLLEDKFKASTTASASMYKLC